MTTASEEILARYSKVERETDAFGRLIGVKRLKPSQQLKIIGMTGDLEDLNAEMPDEDGNPISVPYRAQAIMAASVMEIDGRPISFPRNRAELDAVMDSLDQEGLSAAAVALAKLSGIEKKPKDDGEPETGAEAAKNLPGTPTSDSASG